MSDKTPLNLTARDLLKAKVVGGIARAASGDFEVKAGEETACEHRIIQESVNNEELREPVEAIVDYVMALLQLDPV